MKKYIILVSLLVVAVLIVGGCKSVEKSGNEVKQADYTAFLSALSASSSSDDILEYLYRDLDNNGISELVVAKNGLDITVYTFGDAAVKVGSRNFETGTTRLLFSDNPSYPGIFYFFVSGGLEHHGYLAIADDKLTDDKLWNEDYSGISKELGISHERIEEFSADKQLINESRMVYEKSNDLSFQKLR